MDWYRPKARNWRIGIWIWKSGSFLASLSLLTGMIWAQGSPEPRQQGEKTLQSLGAREVEDPKQRLARLQQQLQAVDEELEEAQNRALRDEGLQKRMEAFTERAKKEMLRIAPGQEAKIERRFGVYEELIEIQRQAGELSEEQQEERLQKVKEFQKLRQALADVERKASQNEEVVEKQKLYRETLIEAMTVHNEKVPELLRQRRALLKQFRRAQLELRSQQKDSSGAAEPPLRSLPTN